MVRRSKRNKYKGKNRNKYKSKNRNKRVRKTYMKNKRYKKTYKKTYKLTRRYIRKKKNIKYGGTTLKELIQKTQYNRDTNNFERVLTSNNIEQWILDSDISECMKCNKKFGLFYRKHHCRNCGGIFCSDCSSKTRHFGKGVELILGRVCDYCFYLEPNKSTEDTMYTGTMSTTTMSTTTPSSLPKSGNMEEIKHLNIKFTCFTGPIIGLNGEELTIQIDDNQTMGDLIDQFTKSTGIEHFRFIRNGKQILRVGSCAKKNDEIKYKNAISEYINKLTQGDKKGNMYNVILYLVLCLDPKKETPLPKPQPESQPESQPEPQSEPNPIHILILGRTLEEQNKLDEYCDGLLNKLGISGSDIFISFLDHGKGKPGNTGQPEITGKIRKIPIKKSFADYFSSHPSEKYDHIINDSLTVAAISFACKDLSDFNFMDLLKPGGKCHIQDIVRPERYKKGEEDGTYFCSYIRNRTSSYYIEKKQGSVEYFRPEYLDKISKDFEQTRKTPDRMHRHTGPQTLPYRLGAPIKTFYSDFIKYTGLPEVSKEKLIEEFPLYHPNHEQPQEHFPYYYVWTKPIQ